MSDIFLVPGLRTPFAKGGGAFASHTALELSAPIATAMNARAKPDSLVWGQVIPDPKLDAEIPSFSDVVACSTSHMKERAALASGARAVVSICADGGQGTVALLERV